MARKLFTYSMIVLLQYGLLFNGLGFSQSGDFFMEKISIVEKHEPSRKENSFNIVKKQPLSEDSWGDEYITNTDLFLEKGTTQSHVVMETDLGFKKMSVSIPPEISVIGEKKKTIERTLQAPRDINIDGGEIRVSEKMTRVHGIFHVGDKNDSLSFEKEGEPFPVEITYANKELLDLPQGEMVVVYSSQDGENREYHSDAVITHVDGMGIVTFETTHMTYFYVGSILGNFVINNDDVSTITGAVTLNMGISGADEMRFGNSVSEKNSASRESYASTKSWTLTGAEGSKTVYAQFRDGVDTVDVLDEIIWDSTPITIPFTGGLTLWYDASVSSSITSSVVGVSEWSDQSGNAYDSLQPNVTGNQPDLVHDVTLGKDVISFNGSDDYLAIETLNYDNTTALSGILVCTVFKTSYNASASYSSNWAFLDYDRSEFFNMYIEGDGDIGLSYASSAGGITDNSGNGTYNDGNWHVACASFDGTALNDTVITADGGVIYNQNRVATGTVLSDATTRFGFIGEGSEAGTFNAGRNNIYYDGSIAEILYFEGSKTITERQEIECYLGEKRGVAVSGCIADTILPIATVDYSVETDTPGYVMATLSNYSEPIIITNNLGSATYVFDDNGSFIFEYEDFAGNTGSTIATVGRITTTPTQENEAPTITSNGGGASTSLVVLSGATSITTVTSVDNMHNVIGEFGDSTLRGSGTMNIQHAEICDPVVVVSHRQLVHTEIQRAPRITSKFGTGFDVKVDNYNSTLDSIETTPIDYVVFASGSHDLNGMQLEAGSESVSTVACNGGGSYSGPTINFSPSFDTLPSVLHTIASNNDPSRVVSHVNGNGTRSSEPTVSQMQLALHRSFNNCTHGSESIDYLAFEQGHVVMDSGFIVDATISSDTIACCDLAGYPISYDTPFTAPPETILVSQLGEDGGNGGYGVIHEGTAVSTTQVFATVDEDGPGADRGHTAEPFAAVSFSKDAGLFFEDNTITYSLTGDDSSDFTITTEGVLTFISGKSPAVPEDLDLNNIYEVTVEVCDTHCNSQCDTQDISVVVGGDICIDIPTSPLILGSYASSSTGTVISQQLSGYFSVEDNKGLLSGWYTTLNIPSFSGSNYGDELGSSVFEWQAGTIDLLGGSVNTGVVLDSGWNSYVVATGSVTFLKRDAGVNSGILGKYGTILDLRLTIPAYTRADTYVAKIVYTLYEN